MGVLTIESRGRAAWPDPSFRRPDRDGREGPPDRPGDRFTASIPPACSSTGWALLTCSVCRQNMGPVPGIPGLPRLDRNNLALIDRSSPPPGIRTLAALATIGLIVGCSGGRASAASTAGSRPSAPAAHAAHHCKCGMDCGATCCCAPRRTADAPAPPPRAPGRPRDAVTDAPCLTSAPCGGALPPGTGPLVRLAEPADRTALAGAPRACPEMLLAPPASDRAGGRAGCRVDEPPERLADA